MIAINSSQVVQQGVWYHVASVGDAAKGTLSLYVDGRLAGSCAGFTGLFVPSGHGMWTLGRGQFNGRVADRFFGSLDEVRFSDEALVPDRFLDAAPPPPPAAVVAPAPVVVIIPETVSQPPERASSHEDSSPSTDATKRRSGPMWPAKR